jgi:hypothetical protein
MAPPLLWRRHYYGAAIIMAPLLYAEYVAEDLLLDLPHWQFIFTIPKILQPSFKYDKRLFGEFARFHPHWHVLVLEGGFTKYDRFVYLPLGADDRMLKVWQPAILSLFVRKKLIDQARVNMLKDWKHSGFSIESETRLFSKADREAACQ